MAITFFGVASVPSDNGSNTANPSAFSNPPIASMQINDLCFVYAFERVSAGTTITINNNGGQSWFSSSLSPSAGATLTARFFYCVFNGTWSAAPSWNFTGTTNNTLVMLVFRPSSQFNGWVQDASNFGTFSDTAAAATFTITGWTPLANSNLCIAICNTDDDNTWGTLTGANWTKTGLSAQYRNTAGQDTSCTIAYQIQTVAAGTNNVSQTQLTLGNDPGWRVSVCFAETILARPMFVKQAVNRAATY